MRAASNLSQRVVTSSLLLPRFLKQFKNKKFTEPLSSFRITQAPLHILGYLFFERWAIEDILNARAELTYFRHAAKFLGEGPSFLFLPTSFINDCRQLFSWPNAQYILNVVKLPERIRVVIPCTSLLHRTFSPFSAGFFRTFRGLWIANHRWVAVAEFGPTHRVPFLEVPAISGTKAIKVRSKRSIRKGMDAVDVSCSWGSIVLALGGMMELFTLFLTYHQLQYHPLLTVMAAITFLSENDKFPSPSPASFDVPASSEPQTGGQSATNATKYRKKKIAGVENTFPRVRTCPKHPAAPAGFYPGPTRLCNIPSGDLVCFITQHRDVRAETKTIRPTRPLLPPSPEKAQKRHQSSDKLATMVSALGGKTTGYHHNMIRVIGEPSQTGRTNSVLCVELSQLKTNFVGLCRAATCHRHPKSILQRIERKIFLYSWEEFTS
ncbi:hypothetical protein DFH09DRAFT_1110020 [Mycena vulgaris]|nr:hypothetical protein DFH09DRAFT_1110020 [Mycena vulgaris]